MPAIITRIEKFGDDLALEDRKLLRAVVRKVHRRFFASSPTNAECDQLIDAMGPEVQARTLAQALKANGEIPST